MSRFQFEPENGLRNSMMEESDIGCLEGTCSVWFRFSPKKAALYSFRPCCAPQRILSDRIHAAESRCRTAGTELTSQRPVRGRSGFGMRFVIPGLVWFAAASGLGQSQTITIAVNPAAQSQTHKYWMVGPTTGGPNGFGMISAQPNWPSIKQAFIGQLVNQLGINTLQFTDHPSDIETNVDLFGLCSLGPQTDPHCQGGDSQALYVAVNDDNDPNHFNCPDQTLVNCPTTFPLTMNDWHIEHYWLGTDGMKAQVQAAGRTPYYVLQYLHRTNNSAFLWNSAAELAEEITAVFLHDYNKYNFVPDILDLDVEPDGSCEVSGNAPSASTCYGGGGHWTYALLGNFAQTVKTRLNALGFTPEIWCCSTVSSGDAAAWYQGVKAVAGSGVITGLSTHWYDGSVSNLSAARAAAAVDGLPTIMTELDVLALPDDFAIEASLESAGSMRYGDIDSGYNSSTAWLTLLSSAPYSAEYMDGRGPGGARGPTWYFPQVWGYVPDGSIREAVTSSSAIYTPLAFVRPDGTHVVSVITNQSNASPSLQVTGLPAGTYGCTYTLGSDRSHFLLPCGPNRTISAGGALNYTISNVLGTVTGSITMAATVFGVQNDQVSVSGVSNAAGGSPSVEGGSWVSIYGVNLSSTTRSWRASDFPNGGGLPMQLDGVSVTFGGKSAAVSYVSPGQLNVQAPDTGSGTVPVRVMNAFGSGSGSATFLPAAPGFFQQGNYVAAVHLDGAYVAPVGYFGSAVASRPARPGEAIQLFGAGFGPTTPPIAAGQLVSAPAILTNLAQLSVQIGGANASVLWAGIVVAGEYQVNVIVPNVPDGDQPVVAGIGGNATQSGLLISVKQ